MESRERAIKFALSLAILVTAAPASAATFGPASTLIDLQGPMIPQTSHGYATCSGTLKGRINAGGGMSITSLFTGGVDPKCRLTAAGLPYRVRAMGPRAATIYGVAWASGEGVCGPMKVTVVIDAKGAWRLDRKAPPHACALRGEVTPTPVVSIRR